MDTQQRTWPQIHDRTLTFQMVWNIERCARRFILDWTKVRGEQPPEAVLARKIGKTFERIRAAETDQEKQAALNEVLTRVAPDDRPVVLERLAEHLEVAAEIDAENEDESGTRVSEKQVQFYADLPNGWRGAALLDEIQYDNPEDPDAIIRIIDEKTGGWMYKKLRDNFFFFGMVVSLAKSAEAKAELVKALDDYRILCRAERRRWLGKQGKKGHRGNRGRNNRNHNYGHGYSLPQRPRMRRQSPIELKPILTGKRKNEEGKLVPAIQPEPFFYSRGREHEQVSRAQRATVKIDKHFAADDFPAEKNPHCATCPFWRGCPGYEQWKREQEAVVSQEETATTTGASASHEATVASTQPDTDNVSKTQ
jgi:hypothetical protein